MWRLKLLLLPFGAIAELIVLAMAWMLAIVGASDRSQALHDWATSKLPNLDWYTNK